MSHTGKEDELGGKKGRANNSVAILLVPQYFNVNMNVNEWKHFRASHYLILPSSYLRLESLFFSSRTEFSACYGAREVMLVFTNSDIQTFKHSFPFLFFNLSSCCPI